MFDESQLTNECFNKYKGYYFSKKSNPYIFLILIF